MKYFWLYFIVFLLALCSYLDARQVLGEGSGEFDFSFRLGDETGTIKVYYHAPALLKADSRIVFVLHSDSRDGKAYRDEWRQYAEQNQFLVLCPEFPDRDFSTWEFHCGNVYDSQAKRYNPKNKWTFNIIEQIFDYAKADRQMNADYYVMFGHSAGAQFVHRMVLLMPEARFSTAIANAPGSYTRPTFELVYADGLKNTPATDQTLKKAFGKELILLIGDLDKVSPQMPDSYDRVEHVYDRLWRGKLYYQEAQAKAEALGVKLNWTLKIVPGADHINPRHALFACRYVNKATVHCRNGDYPETVISPTASETPRWLYEKESGFSYDPPEGWKIVRNPKVEHSLVVDPNANQSLRTISVNRYNVAMSLNDYTNKYITNLKKQIPATIISKRSDFQTLDGKSGLCLVSENPLPDKTSLRQIIYIFSFEQRKYVVTCTARATDDESAALFGNCIKTFRIHQESNEQLGDIPPVSGDSPK